MSAAKVPPTSTLVVEQAFDVQDAAFLDLLCALADPKFHAAFAPRWLRDPRPWARDRIFEYLERPLAHRGHEPLVKRLFKGAEAARDDALMGAFLAAFDRAVRRRRERSWSFDRATRTAIEGERLVLPRDVMPRVGRMTRRNNPVTGAPEEAPARAPKDARLFRHATRNHLRRRAWRWFRHAGFQRPDEYVRIVAAALLRYRDDDLARGENLLDSWGLVHACFGESDRLDAGRRRIEVVGGAGLANLTAAPRFPTLWAAPGAAGPLVDLLTGARSRLVRTWAADLLRRHHAGAVAALPTDRLTALLGHPDEEVQAFAAEAFRGAPGLGSLPVETWLAVVTGCGSAARPTVCEMFEAHVAPARLSIPQIVGLATARPAPIALLGLRFLRQRGADAARELDVVAGLADTRCDAAGHESAVLGLLLTGADAVYSAERVIRFFDALCREVREGAWEWLGASPRAWSDPALWARLVETPYEDLRLRIVEALARRADGPRVATDVLAPVWASVLLSVRSGSRQRPAAIAQVADAVLTRPADADRLLPVLAAASRSIRAPDRRAALAAVAMLVEQQPDLAGAVARHLPEVRVGGQEAVL